jgi:hypothetical protein
MLKMLGSLLALVAILASPASANVVTDWDEIAVKALQPSIAAPAVNPGLLPRGMAMTQVAMFTAANCIEPRYQGYKMQLERSPETSMDAAVASAAANVLMKIIPVNDIRPILSAYLAKIPDGPAKDRGIKLGEEVAVKIVKMREVMDRKYATPFDQSPNLVSTQRRLSPSAGKPVAWRHS